MNSGLGIVEALYLLALLLVALLWALLAQPTEWDCHENIFNCPDEAIAPWPAAAHYFLTCRPFVDPSRLDRDEDRLPCESQMKEWLEQMTERKS